MDDKLILYHVSQEIVEFPEIRLQRYNKDFYFGFYCTNIKSQAVRWAARFDGKGYLSEFEYTPDIKLNVRTFSDMTEEWLDFIVDCRLGKPHNFDIVEGPMANDTIFNYVQDFADQKISREAFWALAKFSRPTHQISFHTARALATLRFVRGLEVTNEV
jgi:hypothetical protein